MRFMSVNLRFENDFDGENHWTLRRDLLAKTILKYKPQVVGTQEGKPTQLAFLEDALQGYRMSADTRHWDGSCQYPTLYYVDDYFVLLEGSEFWLSETPGTHMSKNWDSAFPRMLSYALLETKQTGKRLWAAVTHLDHVSEWARIEGAKLIRDWATELKAPAVLLGDFNDVPGSHVHRILSQPGGPFTDSWEAMGRKEHRGSYTQHGFTGVPGIGRIDWILVTSDFRVMDGAVVHDHEDGRYPSDHFPYYADLELK
ncbi:MAG: endonuclease/exonuclease/phosphatase family protein [Deltaproteobacteria bacterium]|nr:MAG: endonuclease/exonuclease/phosphatase family protein [Deltaproteobacteria bacterium]